MKILLVTPIRPKPGDPHRLWLKALRLLGHQVRLFNLSARSNIKLIKSWRLSTEIKQYQPDWVFFSAGLDAVRPIKNTIFFTGVSAQTLSADERSTGRLAKLVVVNEPAHVGQWRRLGAAKALCLPISAVDATELKPRPGKRTIGTSFIGSLFPERQRVLARLGAKTNDLRVWGWLPPGVELLAGLKPFYRGEAWGKAVGRIYRRSLIGLNLAPRHLPLGGNLRTFEITGAGALLLTDRLNPAWLAGGQEAVKFHGFTDCTQKINYYLAHREKLKQISAAGQRRVKREHTYRHRFRALISYISSL